ncbi:Calcium uptake protein, mitochondrial [Glycine soja]|uniref:Calcium uptake protein, mitochondrial n=1 Tax=Glycine soja TaxID=3848 RepID=A0A445H5C4_GLYSO|nr:Calcium uptake protein, mitochondrial [Glycine soja]
MFDVHNNGLVDGLRIGLKILRLEFAHYDYQSRQTISAKDFALSMVASADMSHLGRLLERVDGLNDDPRLKDARLTFEDLKNFAELRKKLLPFSLALFSFGEVNGLLTRDDFQRAASHVYGISLSNIVVEIVFHLFDANRDGNLSFDEFVRVLHKREKDVAQPMETGIMGWLSCGGNRMHNPLSSWMFS